MPSKKYGYDSEDKMGTGKPLMEYGDLLKGPIAATRLCRDGGRPTVIIDKSLRSFDTYNVYPGVEKMDGSDMWVERDGTSVVGTLLRSELEVLLRKSMVNIGENVTYVKNHLRVKRNWRVNPKVSADKSEW